MIATKDLLWKWSKRISKESGADSTEEKKPTLRKRLKTEHKEKSNDEGFLRRKKGWGPGREMINSA